jgi:hypothetical protein
MTSVLTFGGLNYQAANPLRNEIQGIRRELGELRAFCQALQSDVGMLRMELGKVSATTLPALASEGIGAPAAPSSGGAAGAAASGGAAGGSGQQFGANAVGRRL